MKAINSLFPICCLPRFQNKSWCKTIQMEMNCVFYDANQTHYHLDGLAPRLAFNLRHTATRKLLLT